MVAIILKFLGPVLAFYFFQKWIRQTFGGLGGSGFTKDQVSSSYPKDRSKEDIIEICPDCGNVAQKNHKCT